MSIDYSINIVGVAQIVAMIVGGLMVLATLKMDVNTLKDGAKALKDDFVAMQSEIKKLSEILINLADIRGDIKTLSTRVAAAEQDIREMRNK